MSDLTQTGADDSDSASLAAALSINEAVLVAIEKRARRRAQLPLEALVWLAVAPTWSVPLARAAGLPPGDFATVEALFAELCGQRVLIASAADPRRDLERAEASYKLTEAACAEAARRAAHEHEPAWTQATLAAAGKALLDAGSSAPTLFETYRRAAQLAAAAGDATETPAALLSARIDDLVGAKVQFGADADERVAEATRWVDAALRLAPFVDLLQAAAQAGRVVELFLLRVDDERRLKTFLERPEQTDAFRAFVERQDGPWALHYLGPAGFGKTMLLRFIAGRLAPQLDLATARIDFDLLHPDYPLHSPWLLLEALAEQLRRHDPSGKFFFAFGQAVLQLREALSRPQEPATIARLWREYGVVARFAEALAAMPKRAVLLFDTCEELARVGAGATSDAPPNVRATLAFIEELHAEEQRGGRPARTRVVFFGRRKLPERDYIERIFVNGFTEGEVASYLEGALAGSSFAALREDPRTLAAVIKRSRLVPRSAHSALLERPSPREAPRHNPFVAALAVKWLRDEPTAALDSLGDEDPDAYVKVRIIERVASPGVLALLPAAAVLGSFDSAMLRSVWRGEEAGFSAAFEALRRHEYVQPAEDLLEIDPALRPQLLAYFERVDPSGMQAIRRALLGHFDVRFGDAGVPQMGERLLETLAGLLQVERERAVERWSAVERRLAEARRGEVLKRVCDRLLGDEGALGRDAVARDAGKALQRAAMLASYASAMRRSALGADVVSYWQEVSALVGSAGAGAAPDLLCRARAGLVAATCALARTPDAEALSALWESASALASGPRRDEELAAGVIAALDELLELATSRDRVEAALLPPAGLLASLAEALLARVDAGLAATAFALHGRALALAGEVAGAAAAFEQADALVGRSRSRLWLDWRAPAEPRSRIRLEHLAALYGLVPAAELAAVARRYRQELAAREAKPGSIDADRLLSATLFVENAVEPVALTRREIEAVPSIDTTIDTAGEWRTAYAAYPPACVTVAEVLGRGADVGEAFRRLDSLIGMSERAVLSEIADRAERAVLRLACRMRLPARLASPHSSPEKLLHPSRSPYDWDLGFSVQALLDGGPAAADAPPADPEAWPRSRRVHAWWRATPIQSASDTRRARALLALPWPLDDARPAPGASQPRTDSGALDQLSFGDVAGLLDRFEAARVLEQWSHIVPAGAAVSLERIEQWCAAHARSVASGFRLALRAALFSGASFERLEPIVAKVGKRRAAEIALEEASLLELRLPGLTFELFVWAYDWSEEVGDALGKLLALTSAVVASVRRSGPFSVANSREVLRGTYETARSQNQRLGPAWPELEEVAGDLSRVRLAELGQLGYRGLLTRIVLLLRPASGQEDWDDLAAYLHTAFAGARQKLPLDIEGLVAAHVSALPGGAARWSTPLLDHSEPLRMLSLTSADPARAELGPAELALRPLAVRIASDGFEAVVEIDPREEPARTAPLLPPDLVSNLAARPAAELLVLAVDLGTAAIGWESILSEVLPPRPLLWTSPMARPVPPRTLHEVHLWALSSHVEGMFTRSWHALGATVQHHGPGPLEPAKNIDVAHFVVAPVPTDRGVRIALAGDDYESYAFQRSFSESGGDPIEAKAIARAFPDLALCIVQLLPGRELGTRADRAQTAFLRLFAAELMESAACTIVVIPALPPEDASELVHALGSALVEPDWPLRLAVAIAEHRQRAGGDAMVAAALREVAVFGVLIP